MKISEMIFKGLIVFYLLIMAIKLTSPEHTEEINRVEEPMAPMDTVWIEQDTVFVVDTAYLLCKNSDLIEAIIYVESKGNDNALNTRSNAAGCLQIRPVMVREVNRISSKIGLDKIFSLSDRYSRPKSIEMFNIWEGFHHRTHSAEVVARCWNGGNDGDIINGTLGYWNKVKNNLTTKQ